MATAKEEVWKLLNDLPDSATYEDIQYSIYVREKIEKGLQDVAAGRLLTEDEMRRELASWLRK